ncbi:hypothetical protein PspKH34_13700 [Parageobacillus sp. KH3-4]|nr:hypothetical protein PspKH34_13700 [Parageobacillus sp. KH3-4]
MTRKKKTFIIYGFIPEVFISSEGMTRVVKHYSTGHRIDDCDRCYFIKGTKKKED